MVSTNQLSVFAIKQGENRITHRVFSRNGQRDFLGAASLSPTTLPPIEFPTSPFLFPASDITVINPNGANTGSRLDVFVRKIDNQLGWCSSLDGGLHWGAWTTPPNVTVLNSNVAASSYGANSVIMYVLGVDGLLYKRDFNPPGTWTNWQSVQPPPGVTVVGTPAVIGTPSNKHRVYVRDQSGNIWEASWTGTSLGPWFNRTTLFGSPCSFFPQGVDQQHQDDPPQPPQPQEGFNVFFISPTTNRMRLAHNHYGVPASFTYDWGGSATSAPGAAYWKGAYTTPTSRTFQELHVFVRGSDNKLYGRFGDVLPNAGVVGPQMNPNVPTNWYSLSAAFGNIDGRPEAVTWVGNLS